MVTFVLLVFLFINLHGVVKKPHLFGLLKAFRGLFQKALCTRFWVHRQDSHHNTLSQAIKHRFREPPRFKLQRTKHWNLPKHNPTMTELVFLDITTVLSVAKMELGQSIKKEKEKPDKNVRGQGKMIIQFTSTQNNKR